MNEEKITRWLLELSVRPNLKGYHYIREAVRIIVDIGVDKMSMTNNVYPYISEKFNSTPSRVERCIRHAIDYSWEKNSQNFKKVFGVQCLSRPTNSEFLALLADKYILEEKRNNEK